MQNYLYNHLILKHNLNMNSFSNDFSLPLSPTNLRYSLQGNKKIKHKQNIYSS